MTPEDTIKELEHYCLKLNNILSRFYRGSHGSNIRKEDDISLRTIIVEIIDLLADSLRQNSKHYTVQINQIYHAGHTSSPQSQTEESIEKIVAVLTAVITRIKRNPEICNINQVPSSSPTDSKFTGISQSTIYKDCTISDSVIKDNKSNTDISIPSSEKNWYEKPFGLIILAVISGIIVVFLAYYFEWNGPKEKKQQTQEQKQSAIPASDIPKKIPKKTP